MIIVRDLCSFNELIREVNAFRKQSAIEFLPNFWRLEKYH